MTDRESLFESLADKVFSKALRRDLELANGFVGDGFIGVPLSDKQKQELIERVFGERNLQ